MPGRKYTAGSGYRYGFNGQEKSDEIGEGLTSAQYWEYDSRIGRRWNVDPVIKPWVSPYSCFSNSPSVRVDPNGDDDYFDAKGKYLGSDKKGTAVRIISNPISEIKNLYSKDGAMINRVIAQKNSEVLSSFVKGNDAKDLIKKTTLLNGVLNYYAKNAGIQGEVIPDREENQEVPAFTIGKSDTRYNVLFGVRNSKSRKMLDNYNNIISVFDHERLHQIDKEKKVLVKSFGDHAEIYINQFKLDAFKQASKDFQIGQIASAVDYIFNTQFTSTDFGSGNADELMTKLNNVIKPIGYRLLRSGSVSMDLYKGKELVAQSLSMTEKKTPK